MQRRASSRRPAPLQNDLQDVLAACQGRLREIVSERGIIVETNPSSNLRMLDLSRVQDLPVLSILRDGQTPVRVTVCTDNPGLYATSVGAEYGILFAALQGVPNAMGREQALELLEKCRRTGLEKVNWRQGPFPMTEDGFSEPGLHGPA